MELTDIKELYRNRGEYIGREVTIGGWVRSNRDSKNFGFLMINDGTFFEQLQVVYGEALDNFGEICKVNVGAALIVRGTIVETPNAKQPFEMQAAEVTVEGPSSADYPLQKKRHTFEYLRTISHLRPRTNTFQAVFRVRSLIAYAIHSFFMERGFVYVHTPLITGSDCEGAGEIFRVTTNGYENAKLAKDEAEYIANDFFRRKAGLTVSGQLEGEVAAMAMGKIYTFGPTFRAENSNTPRHAAEFWQVEPEVAFAKLPDIIEIAQSMIKYIIKAVIDECPEELAFFEKAFEAGLREKLRKVVDSDFVVLDYAEAIKILEKSGEKFQYPVEWGLDLQSEHERYITEKVFNKPVFVTNYPKKIKSFYMKQNDDGLTVAATDLLVPGVGEIIGCSEREADYEKLKQAMIDRNMNLEDYTGYLDLRKYGSVPHSGFGLGLERIMMYVTGIGNIRDVQLYSRTAGDLM